MKSQRPPGKLDPQLVELVRFLARRAAERDYKELLDEWTVGQGPFEDQEE